METYYYYLGFLSVVVIILSYFYFIKPYLIVIRLKREFQNKGFKVLVQPLNFLKDQVIPLFNENLIKNKDSVYHLQYKYQGYDIVIHNSMNQVFIWVVSLPMVKQTFKQIQSLQKLIPMKENFKRLSGGGFFMAQGKQWRNKRKSYSQIFSFKLLDDIHPYLQTATQNVMNKWKLNQPLDMLTQMRNVFANIIAMSYFGCEMDNFNYKDRQFGELVVQTFDQVYNQSFSNRNFLLGTKFLKKGLFQQDRLIEENIQVINNYTVEFLNRKIEQIQKGEVNEDKSILSKLVASQDFKNSNSQTRKIFIKEMVGDLLSFFFAGTDTTSAALVTTLHLLNKHPHIKKCLIEQLKSIGNLSSPADYKKLKYMDGVINEVFRMYGPGNVIFARQVTKDNIKLGEVALPKGLVIGVQTVSNHYSQEYFENPSEFKPQRWSKSIQNPYSFIPFSSGLRNCIGQHLARFQYKVVLSRFLQKFQFHSNDSFEMSLLLAYVPVTNQFTLTKIQD